MDLINIGYGNIVVANRIVSVINSDSAPLKRMVSDARENNMLIDATYGRKTRTIIVMDSGHLVLTPIQQETIANRLSELK